MSLDSIPSSIIEEEAYYSRYIVSIGISRNIGFVQFGFSFQNRVGLSFGYLKVKLMDSGDVEIVKGNLKNKEFFMVFIEQYLSEYCLKNQKRTGLDSFINTIKVKINGCQ
ncbi:MAG: hypothetical protein PHI37_02225 [Candidatus Gracilibacteria bacterium]|nr:hypothetical protein [Candidatus Gracilibacteria bacterium]